MPKRTAKRITKRTPGRARTAAPRRRRPRRELPQDAVKRFGLLLSPPTVLAIERAARDRKTSASAVIAGVLEGWAAPPAPLQEVKTESLERFAERVRASAKQAMSGPETTPMARGTHFGTDKAFISAVWRGMEGGPSYSLEAFKARLVEANRARLVSLSRADLVQAMHPADVSESETLHLGSTFNFVNVP